MPTYKPQILDWVRRLRSRRSQSGEFEYKPLLVLSVLEILDKTPEHPNFFQYEELFEAAKVVASRNNWKIDEQQFAHPYLRLKNDKQPVQVWIPQPIDGIDLDDYEIIYPPHVKRDIPSIKINDYLWESFQNLEDRVAFEQEIKLRLYPLPLLR
ncbi:hypothetical protein ACN4EG_11360 [Alkalinema pantanalense CENA528]|uniref:hypothetical protein n=1 Tax=Alkalinema pantanalense TaxID=1620705 RepID=UPI003D6E6D4E